MNLLSTLAAGVRGAENGFVDLLLRGTSTASTYYSDFEATQQYPGTGIQLDSYGRLIAYVAALVDVVVKDANGVTVCEFVAGSEDAAVEVISPSFTGVDYTSGASGVQKPTNLERVLDSWVESAGAPDFKVLVNGVASNITTLAGGSFYNVRSFGAVGNGIADDGTAIANANAAVVAAGGGILYWPAGTYRVTAPVTLPPSVFWLGTAGLASKLAIDNGADVGAVAVTGGATGAACGMQGMWIGEVNTAGSTQLLLLSGTAEFYATYCTFGNDAVTAFALVGLGGTAKGTFTRCLFRAPNGFGAGIGSSSLTLRDCEIVWTSATAGTVLQAPDRSVISGNRFSMPNATAGTPRYIAIAPAAVRPVITDNYFAGNATVVVRAIYNSLAAKTLNCVEYGNVFGDTSFVTPYENAVGGYSVLTSSLGATGNGSRLMRVEGSASAAATISVDPGANSVTSIQRTAGAALTVNATSFGSTGDYWVLHILNNTGAGLTVTLGANIVGDGVAFTVTNGGFGKAVFVFLSSGAAVGNWHQVAPAART